MKRILTSKPKREGTPRPKSTVKIIDGGLATELERAGHDLNHKLWSAKLLQENPKAIEKVHFDYAVAGADILITASYQAAQIQPGLIHRSVSLAQSARKESGREDILIAGSVGPYGAFLAGGEEYTGDYELSQKEYKDFHRPRMTSLAQAGVDFFAFETIPLLDEAFALAELLTEFPEQKAWLCFSCKDHEHNCFGENVGDCAVVLEDFEQIMAIGVNCTAPQYISSLLEELANGSTKDFVVYPNSGATYSANDKTWSKVGTDDVLPQADVKKWVRKGAKYVGGCCGTTPEDTRRLKKALKSIDR